MGQRAGISPPAPVRGAIHLRLAHFEGGGRGGRGGFGFGGGAAEAMDLSQPQTLTAYGEWTKKSGYYQMPAGGGRATPLIYEDQMIGQAQKAKTPTG